MDYQSHSNRCSTISVNFYDALPVYKAGAYRRRSSTVDYCFVSSSRRACAAAEFH